MFAAAIVIGVVPPAFGIPTPTPLATPSPGETQTPQDTVWSRIQHQKRLRVGIDPALGSPYLYADVSGNVYRGFEWEIAQALGKHLQVEVVPVYVPWGGQLTGLQQGEVDVIIGLREAAGLDQSLFRASKPYFWSLQRLVVRTPEAESITQLSHLFGKRVGILVDSAGAALLEGYNRQRGNAIQLFASSQPPRLFQQLRSGQLDALLIDQAVAIPHTRDSELEVVGPGLLPTPLVVVMPSEAESLQHVINQAITEIQKDGTWQAILEAWQLWDPALKHLVSPKD
ncbi:MAG: transporter substrate-binding domain-containing protein [Synechococcales cyanobacterium]